MYLEGQTICGGGGVGRGSQEVYYKRNTEKILLIYMYKMHIMMLYMTFFLSVVLSEHKKRSGID